MKAALRERLGGGSCVMIVSRMYSLSPVVAMQSNPTKA